MLTCNILFVAADGAWFQGVVESVSQVVKVVALSGARITGRSQLFLLMGNLEPVWFCSHKLFLIEVCV